MSDLIIPRRSFLAGLGLAMVAPAIVRAESLMKLPIILKSKVGVVTPNYLTQIAVTDSVRLPLALDGMHMVVHNFGPHSISVNGAMSVAANTSRAFYALANGWFAA